MKKLMWAISIFSLLFTATALQFMPDSVPMHYDLAGNIDRWGSKYENLIFPRNYSSPVSALASIYHALRKKATKTSIEKEHAESLSNAKVLKIVGISMAAMFMVIQSYSLYSAYVEARSNATQTYIDTRKISCILIGVMLIVLGNYMPKTKKDHIAGVKVSQSMYNDTTWMKNNRFDAVAMMVAGLLTIITTIFVNSTIAMVLLLAYILIATAIILIYSHNVYKAELSKNNTSQ